MRSKSRIVIQRKYYPHLKSNKTPQNDENLTNCIHQNGADWGDCVLACADDKTCEDDCVTAFKQNSTECPCMVSWYFEAI